MKEKKFYQKWWFWAICLFIVITIINSNNEVSEKSNVENVVKIESSEEKLLKKLSAWDGSLRPLVDIVKENMKDPDSFDHDKTTYLQTKNDSTDFLIKMTYRGKNSFGAVVKNSVRCIYNINSENIRDFSQSQL